jgi:hypothetical protein
MEFEIVCPNNHNQTVSFTREEFHDAQKSGGLAFHCNTCDANWSPGGEAVKKMREALDQNE